MKLISKGHDYYDGAGMGVDETVIFVRKPREILDAPFEIPKKISGRGENWARSLTFHLIILGGEIFPVLQETIPSKWDHSVFEDEKSEFYYDKESAMAALVNFEENHNYRSFLGLRNEREDIERHFSQNPTKEQIDWVIENRVITGRVYRRKIYDEIAQKHEIVIQADADISNLKDYHFYKALDPATAHMRIANFIGGVLPHGPETVEISDKHKIMKAGHDPVTSFRTPKGAKKPRRKKS